MKRKLLLLLFMILVISLCPSFALAADTPEGSAPTESIGAFEGDTDFEPDISDSEETKDSMSDAEKKLSSSLLQLTDNDYLLPNTTQDELIAQMKEQDQISEAYSTNGSVSIPSGLSVHVYIQLTDGYDADALSKYVSKIENQDEDYNLVTAWVDIDSLKSLAALDVVKNIREVIPPIVYTGSVTSEGDAVLKADLTRAMGVTGAGIKVGIISDGVDSYASAVASGDLPSSLTILSNTAGGDEGTAMLEIVHDLAPDAQLYFHDCGDSKLDFNDAIDELAAAGCDIICDDIGWLLEPFFEDGIVAQHIQNLISTNDIIYVTAAGNEADTHYQGIYEDLGDGTADFSHGSSSTPYLYVNLSAGASLIVVMEWNDVFGSSGNDYNLYLYNYSTGEKLAQSKNVQDGDDDPLEAFQYINNTGGAIDVAIVAEAYNNAADKTLEIYTYGGSMYTNNVVSADSIYGHAAVPGVLSCGAIRQSTPDVIEYFSSCGPVTMLSGTRNKPDICGIDGVSVTGAGGFGSYYAGKYYFYGTSAAAPHIAAVAALLESKFTSASASEIRQLILDTSDDLGSAGYDTIFGYGRANAYTAASNGYSVSFNSSGGSTVDSQQIIKNGKVAKPTDPTKSGYAFVGWYKDTACTTAWDFSTNIVTANTTLYAKWAYIKCQTHVQNVGWQDWKNGYSICGTTGQSLRLEAIQMKLDGIGGGIEYKTHVQNIGWQDWVSNGALSGTSGQSLRLEAIQIRLTGEAADTFDVYYRVHAQNFGWMGWAKNGESAGTAGFSYRLEAIQIELVPKDSAAPGSTSQPFVQYGTVSYQSHVQNVGWQSWASNGAVSGTSGQSLRLEAMRIQLSNIDGGIQYKTHVQNIGWQDWVSNGALSGTQGQSLRLEAIQIRLTGQAANNFDIYYRVHAQNIGWMGWAKNGESAGTAGMSYRLEAIQIGLVPKGSAAPGSTSNSFVQG